MSVKRWKGATSNAWAALGTTFNDANWLNDAGNALAVAVPQKQQTVNITDVSWGSQAAGVTVTVNVAAGPPLVAGDTITLAGAVHGNGARTVVTSSTTAYTFVDDTSSWGADAGPYAQGTLYFAGDDVQMLSGDKLAASAPSISAATKAANCVLTVGAHTVVAGNLVKITSVAGMTQLNTNTYTVVSVDATHITLNVNSTGFTTYTSGGVATLQTYYCTTGPMATTVINSMVATMAADASGNEIISSNGQYLTISGEVPLPLVGAETLHYNFRYTDAAAVTGGNTTSSVLIGSAGGIATLADGCHGLCTLQPANASASRIAPLNIGQTQGSSASLDIVSLGHLVPQYTNSYVGWNKSISGIACVCYGTLTLSALSVPLLNGAGSACNQSSASTALAGFKAGSVVNINTPSVYPHNIQCPMFEHPAFTININAPTALSDMGAGYTWGTGTIVNVNAPTLIYSSSSQTDYITNDVTINARAPLTLAAMGVSPVQGLSIAGISKAANAVVTITNGATYYYSKGTRVTISGVEGMPEINGTYTIVGNDSSTTITLDVNSTAFGTWTSGGTITRAAATLAVNSYGYAVTEVDVSGTVVVSGVAANAPLTRRRT